MLIGEEGEVYQASMGKGKSGGRQAKRGLDGRYFGQGLGATEMGERKGQNILQRYYC